MEPLPTAKEIAKWRRDLQSNIKRGSRRSIRLSIEEGQLLGLSPHHPDIRVAERVLASFPNGDGSHPSRTEIAGIEPMCARWAEGSLSKAVVRGEVNDFQNAMERFIELIALDAPIQEMAPFPKTQDSRRTSISSSCSTSESTTDSISAAGGGGDGGRHCHDGNVRGNDCKTNLSSIISEIWESADIDGNGLMSESEARETLRIFLSRPHLRKTIGEPLKEVVVKWMAEDPKFAQVLAKKGIAHERLLRLCKHAVSQSCSDIAKKLPDVTDSFWAAMDLSKNGEVDRAEFMLSFKCAIQSHVIARIWERAEERAWKMVEAGCCDAETTEEMDILLHTHIKKKKMKRTVAFEPQPLSAKEEASEFCQSGDCTVM